MLWNIGNALPVAGPGAAQEVKLLSTQSGRYVRAYENNVIIVANSSKNTATVFVTYLTDSTIQLEVKNKPGMFLMVQRVNQSSETGRNNTVLLPSNAGDSLQYALVIGEPSETSQYKWENAGLADSLRSKDGDRSCFIAFDSNGKVVGPCNLSEADPACSVRMV